MLLNVPTLSQEMHAQTGSSIVVGMVSDACMAKGCLCTCDSVCGFERRLTLRLQKELVKGRAQVSGRGQV